MSTRLEVLKASNHYFTAKALPPIHPPNNYNNIFTANKFNFQINTRLRYDYEYMVQFISCRWSHDFEICWIFPTVFPRWMSFQEIFFRNSRKKLLKIGNFINFEKLLQIFQLAKPKVSEESFNWFGINPQVLFLVKQTVQMDVLYTIQSSTADNNPLNSTGYNVIPLSKFHQNLLLLHEQFLNSAISLESND